MLIANRLKFGAGCTLVRPLVRTDQMVVGIDGDLYIAADGGGTLR